MKPPTDLMVKLISKSYTGALAHRSEGKTDCVGCECFGAEHPQIHLNFLIEILIER